MTSEPDWVQHVIWWQVYPLGVAGADTTGVSRAPSPAFGRIGDWLDYVVELGASGVALGPIFASSTHGYDTVDFYRIDDRLGTSEDFEALVEAAHARGLRVLLDGVFNHVGREHPAFLDVLENGADSRFTSWFRLSWPNGPGGEMEYDDFEGHSVLVALDHSSPAVTELVTDVMSHWLTCGADGWRLDAAYAVPPAFWAQVLPVVREQHPDAYIVGEVIHGDYAEIVADSGMDAVTQYELWKAVWSSLKDVNFYELAAALDRHNTFIEAFAPLTFVGNHDVTRIADQIGDDRHVAHAAVVLFTVGGTPSIYYGDEHAFRGVKEERVGGDDAVRPALP
ncbi:MAG: alpha-amylase family glycosyl hydrolase, partial [Allobranchiibius sp.]